MHVDSDLSAYLDGELAPGERARVDAHLSACDRCTHRLAELRATASLIAALPYSRASRSLVPSVTRRWTWLRPVRSLSMVASGAFLFVFLLTAVARSGTGLGGAASAPAAAQPAAAQPAAGAAAAPQPTPAPAAFGTFAPALDQTRSTAATAAPSALLDAQKRADVASPSVAVAPQPPHEGALRAVAGSREPANPLLEPLLWIALAIVAAVVAIASHLRLRRV